MTPRDIYLALKGRIKQLSAEQKADKSKRKGCPAEKQSPLWCAIWRRGARITACLNYYLAFRGKEYRHRVADEYLDKKYSAELAKEFAQEVKA